MYLLPDLDKALVTFLTGYAALVPLHSGRVGTRLAAGTGAAVRVTSLGGSRPWPWETTTDMQVEWWGSTSELGQGEANLLARTGEAALYDFHGQAVTGGRIVGFAVALSMLWSPDDTTGRPRYLTQISLTAQPEGS